MIEAGIHLVHKTVGQSSFDVIRGFKRRAFEAGQKKLALGHGGTLDPFADGLLLVLAGQATRLMELLHPLPKTYLAEVVWGVETDTCDLHGKPVIDVTQGSGKEIHHGDTETTEGARRPPCSSPIGRPEAASGDAGSQGRRRARILLGESEPGASPVPMLGASVVNSYSLNPETLEAALGPFLGWTDQVPPATSAKKIDGEAAYKKAHRGEDVVMKPCRVFLLSARWLSHDLPQRSTLELTCRGGYYVRSLARDLGRALGCRAHLGALRRTAIGPWSDPGEGQERLRMGLDLLPWCPSRLLTDEEADHLSHGRAIPLGQTQPATWTMPEGFPDPGAPLRAMHDGRLVALLKSAEDGWRTFANLRGGL